MKALLLVSTLLLAAAPLVRGADPAAAGPAPAGDDYSLFGPDYKKPQELSENFFNPFKGQATGGDLARKESVSVSNETVTTAIGVRGVRGIVYAPDPQSDRIVIGDQVFAIGDELTFPDDEKAGASPLVAGAAVFLRGVRPDNLQFEVVPDGEAARRLVYSLRGFWRE